MENGCFAFLSPPWWV